MRADRRLRWVGAGCLAVLVAGGATFALTRPPAPSGQLLVLATVARPGPGAGQEVAARVVGLRIEGSASGGAWRSISFPAFDLRLPGQYLAPATASLLQSRVPAGSYGRAELELTTSAGHMNVTRKVGFTVVTGQTTPLLFSFQVRTGSSGPQPLAAYGGESQVSFGLALASKQVRAVPETTFVDQGGKAVRLSDYRGKVVVLASFLTECQETCPLVDAALLDLRRMLELHGLGGQVQILEATQDPAQDTPALLSRYRRYFALPWPLLTGATSAVDSFWAQLGVPPVRALPWDGPAPTNMFTGRQEPYNLIHDSVVEVINPQGYIVTQMQSQPTLSTATVPTTIYKYLDAMGRSELRTGGAWTPQTLYQAVVPLLQQERQVNAFPRTGEALPGKPAPNFTLPSTAGAPVTLSSLRGHPVMLDFWASWCTNCKADMGLIAAAARRYSSRGLRVLLVNDQQSATTARRFLGGIGVKLPTLLDGQGRVTQAYGLPGLPVAVFVKPDGEISSLVLGQLQAGQLQSAIGKMMAA
ncbi:MAG: redoxin domain-containing protein [Candidatus Dormibacteria bacterium]